MLGANRLKSGIIETTVSPAGAAPKQMINLEETEH
jgi:hypothetical protein